MNLRLFVSCSCCNRLWLVAHDPGQCGVSCSKARAIQFPKSALIQPNPILSGAGGLCISTWSIKSSRAGLCKSLASHSLSHTPPQPHKASPPPKTHHPPAVQFMTYCILVQQPTLALNSNAGRMIPVHLGLQ